MNIFYITFCTKNEWGLYYSTVQAKDINEATRKAMIKYGTDFANVSSAIGIINGKKLRENI